MHLHMELLTESSCVDTDFECWHSLLYVEFNTEKRQCNWTSNKLGVIAFYQGAQ